MSISSNDDTDSTERSDGEYDSELDPDGDMCMEDDVDEPDGFDLDGDVDIERDGDNDEEEDEEEEDEEKEDEEEVEEEDEDEEEDKDEDDGKEPRTISQGEMVNTSAHDADIMVDDEPTVLAEQGQEMREHTPPPQPPAPAQRPQTLESSPRLWTLETHTLSGPEFLVLVTPQKPRPAAPTLREAEAARNTSDVDVEQHLLCESADGESLPDVPLPDVPLPDVPLPDVPLPDVPLPDVPLPDVPLPDVPLPDVPLPDVPLPEVRPDGLVDKEWTSPRIAFGLESGSCLVSFLSCNLFISDTD